jgi:hypothetical protein
MCRLWILLILFGGALAQFQMPSFPDPCKLLSEQEVGAAMGAKLQSSAPANQGAQATIGLPVPMCLWSGDGLEVKLDINPLYPSRTIPYLGKNPTPLKDPALGNGAFYTSEGQERVFLYARGFSLMVLNPKKPPLEIARSLALKVASRLP